MAIGVQIKKYEAEKAAALAREQAAASDPTPEPIGDVPDEPEPPVAAVVAPVATAKPTANDERLMLMFERFMERMAAKGDGGLTADQLSQVLESNAKSVQKAMKPENVEGTYPPISAFNPTGDYNKPKLRRKTVYVGAEMRNDFLTPTEIELFNQFTTTREARNGRWTAKLIRNGSTEELHIAVPHKDISDRMDLPNGLSLILRELLDGPEAASVDFMAERLAAAEKQIAALTGA